MGERAERGATCNARVVLCNATAQTRTSCASVAASRAQLANDNEHSRVNTTTKGSAETRLGLSSCATIPGERVAENHVRLYVR